MALVSSSRCERHQVDIKRAEQERGSAAQRGYGRKWQAARAAFLAENPLCKACRDAGRKTAASQVDHIVPHKGDVSLFWRRSNWQALCGPCHSAKTAREDGGFGRAVAGQGRG